ncbi:MAG: glycosyltransferase family 1 protein [bacterium]
MKIGIDARSLLRYERAGLEHHVANLIFNLAKIDKENQYLLFFNFIRPEYKKFLPKFTSKNFNNIVCPIPSKIMTRLFKIHFPIEFCMGKLDVFHGPRHLLLHSIFAKSVLTIHDLMLVTHPEFLTLERVNAFKKNVDNGIKRADLIISVSEFTKNEIIKEWNIPKERIKVIYNGVGEEFYPIEDKTIIEKVKHKYGIKDKYILYVGNIEPKKNLLRLIEAFSLLKNSKDDYNLVIAGNKDWFFDKVFQKVNELNLQEDVIFTGYVPNEELPALYSGAEIFVFPSLYEGFGMPVIEAMACGTPVITSNITSLPEVVKDAGILIDPFNVEEITKAMSQLLTDTNLQTKLREKGLLRAKLFSWGKTARETLAVYKELA